MERMPKTHVPRVRTPEGGTEGTLSLESLESLYQSVREKCGDELLAHLVEANNVLTLAGVRVQTEFYITDPTPADRVRVERFAKLAEEWGVFVSPNRPYKSAAGPTLAPDIINLHALEHLTTRPPLPGFPPYRMPREPRTWRKGLREWWTAAEECIRAAQRAGAIPSECDPDHVLTGLMKGYPLVAVIGATREFSKRSDDRNLKDFHLPIVDLYGGARPEFDYAPTDEGNPTIAGTIKEWDRLLKTFYGGPWHRALARDGRFQAVRRAMKE